MTRVSEWHGGYTVSLFVSATIKSEKKNEVDKVWSNGSSRLKSVNYEAYLPPENYKFKILILYKISGTYTCTTCKYYVSIRTVQVFHVYDSKIAYLFMWGFYTSCTVKNKIITDTYLYIFLAQLCKMKSTCTHWTLDSVSRWNKSAWFWMKWLNITCSVSGAHTQMYHQALYSGVSKYQV